MGARAREDDHTSFTAWAGVAQHSLLRTAVLVCGDHHRAQDLVQDALTKVALRWRTLESGNPDAYARQIIVRDNISWWRRHRRETVTETLPERGATGSPDASVERQLLIRRALSRLTPRQRAVVVLRYFDDLTERDTAELLGVTVGTVKSQTHDALRRMREAAPELAELLGGEAR